MKPLIAVCFYSDQDGTSYENVIQVNSYKEALDYFLEHDEKWDMIEFLSFNDDVSLEEIIADIDVYYADYLEYMCIDEVQKYFNETVPMYLDGTEIKVGDKFSTPAKNFYWGAIFNYNDLYYGTVNAISSPHWIEISFDNSTARYDIAHYKITRIEDEN